MMISSLPYEFHSCSNIKDLIAAALTRQEQEKRNLIPDEVPLVSTLSQRILRREHQINSLKDGEKWSTGAKEAKKDPLEYMQLCRTYLAKMDTQGWNRSYHQRLFHDDFLKACTRSFWKLEKPGQFARDHQKVLRINNWDHVY